MNLILPIFFIVCLFAAFLHASESHPRSVSSLSTRKRSELLYHLVLPGHLTKSLPSPATDNLDIVDIVILATVDGKLHALNRSTGRKLWSFGDDPESSHSAPTTFDSLIRTHHPSQDDSDQELFIIEPQSGDIYILSPTASPTDPLQRLPFSMPQLVEMSPFSFQGDEHRIFVGSKETSMVVIELDTGKVKGTVNADKECFWADDPVSSEEEIDLDELDGTKPPKQKLHSREIHIGRTDYHVRVLSHHQGVVQNLFYSSYGPNNIDRGKQTQWKRTPDDIYFQPLPNGQILAFHLDSMENSQNTMPLWAQTYKEPIVAVFDILISPSRSNPLALLQPRPHFQHLFPRQTSSKNQELHSMTEATYVGLIGDSLFAMSHQNFPLAAFDRKSPGSHIDIPQDSESEESCWGHRCLVGSRQVEPSSQWYIPPLLDGVPYVPGDQERMLPDRAIGGVPVNGDIETNDSRASIGKSTEKRWAYGDAGLGTWGAFSGALVILVLFARTFFMRKDVQVTVGSEFSSKESTTTHIVESTSSPASSAETSIPLSPSPEYPIVVRGTDANAQPLTDKLPPLPPSPMPTSSINTPGDIEDGDESEKEGLPETPRRKGPRRRRRGKKKKSEGQGLGVDADEDDGQLPGKEALLEVAVPPATPATPAPGVLMPPSPSSSLVVSDTVLGFGSHGTVVYEGSLQGRAVAVKRLLQDFVTIASREVELLQESDDHPNVIRYFYKEAKDGFLFIALELCPASLADIIERPDVFAEIAAAFDTKRALAQVTAGLRHLHTLKIVHRDIKPQNILVSKPKNGHHRMLISDFGLCKKLEVDQTSFLPTVHGAMAAGTVGWRAPEILRREVKLDEQPMDPDDVSSRGSTTSGRSSSSTGGGQPTRLTTSVDVFALGCLFYYTLTSGSHPYGDRFEREVNILKGQLNLEGLEQFGEEGVEAAHLILQMLDQDAKARPNTKTCLIHPFFWTSAQRLNFLQDASDRFEVMCREPREMSLVTLETGAYDVVGNDWHTRFDRVFVDNLGKFRKYDGRSVQDLLRALRNKKHHYQDMPDHLRRHLGPLPEGFLGYFTRRFPGLIMHVHGVIWRCGLGQEPMFRSYFELIES